jgi:hypothetical protein
MIRRIFFFLISILSVLPLSAQQIEPNKTRMEKAKDSNSVGINSVKLIIDKANLTEAYEGVAIYSPKSKDQILLVLHLKLLSETSDNTFSEFQKKCFIVDEKDVKSIIAGNEPEYTKAPGDSVLKFSGGLWIFSVPKTSRSFKLILPGNNTIELDALLTSS